MDGQAVANLSTIIQESIFKGILILESEDPAKKSARDKTNLMEKFGAFSSAVDFSSMAVLRNKLSHGYPDDPDKQGELITLAWAAGKDIIVLFDGLVAYIRVKTLIPGLADLTITPARTAAPAPPESVQPPD